MAMNSTSARRFTAVYVKILHAALLVGALWSCGAVLASDCGTGLSAQERIARFKELDSQAEGAMHGQHPAEAVQLYEQAVCLVPNSARGFYGLGVAEAAAGEFAKARESLRTADRLQPTTGMPLVMQARVNFSLNDMEALKSNLREAAARFPRDAELHSTLARFLAEKNLLVLALAEAVRSGQVSDDPASKLQLAVLENTVGAYDDAVRNALAAEQNRALPDAVRASAAGIAGLSYESLRQPDEGVRYLREAIQLDPSQPNSYLALADLFEQNAKYAEAVAVLQQARRSAGNPAAVLLPLGADLIRSEHPKEGVVVIKELLQAAPDTDEAYISLADAARKTGETAQEIDALRTLADRKPDYPMIHVLLARALLNAQPVDYRKVLDELSLAERANAEDPDISFLRGKAYLALGRYDEAVSALDRSIQLRPTDPGPYYQLARVYQKLGKADLAKVQFERVKYLEAATSK